MSFMDFLVHPYMAMIVTLGGFLMAQKIQERLGGLNILNPVVVAIALVVIYLSVFDIPYDQYLKDVHLIHALLGPATVALAVPLYRQLQMIKKSFFVIFGSVFVACVVAAGVAYGLATFMGSSDELSLAIMPKSSTTPIAIGIADKIGVDPSLAVFFVFTTGIIGTLISSLVFKVFRVRDERAIGLSLGTTCHGLGVARAFEYSQKAGSFAALGMSLMGVISGVLLPFFILSFLT